MAQQKLQLRKQRDFGENISDTFQFIRQELKPLLLSFVLISGIFILAQSVLNAVYQTRMFSFLDQLKGGFYRNQPADLSEILTPTYFVMLLIMLVVHIVMRLVIACYAKLYDINNESPAVSEVWNECRKYFFRAFLFSIPEMILMIIGFAFCILPGVYLSVVFTPFVFVLVNEDTSFSDTFSRCFTIIRENFWMSLAIYIVVYLIYSIASGIVGLVLSVLSGVVLYFSTKELSSTVGTATSILGAVAELFTLIFLVSVAFQYYNLTEKTDGTGITRRLNMLGTGSNQNTDIEEQY